MGGLTDSLRPLRRLPTLPWRVVLTKIMVRGRAKGDGCRATATTQAQDWQHPRFVSYHHLLGFFPHSPLLWRGPFPTVATHRNPSEILSGLEAPLNQPVWAADARSHHPLVNTRPLSWNQNAWWRIPPPLLGSSPLVGWSRCGA